MHFFYTEWKVLGRDSSSHWRETQVHTGVPAQKYVQHMELFSKRTLQAPAVKREKNTHTGNDNNKNTTQKPGDKLTGWTFNYTPAGLKNKDFIFCYCRT